MNEKRYVWLVNPFVQSIMSVYVHEHDNDQLYVVKGSQTRIFNNEFELPEYLPATIYGIFHFEAREDAVSFLGGTLNANISVLKTKVAETERLINSLKFWNNVEGMTDEQLNEKLFG